MMEKANGARLLFYFALIFLIACLIAAVPAMIIRSKAGASPLNFTPTSARTNTSTAVPPSATSQPTSTRTPIPVSATPTSRDKTATPQPSITSTPIALSATPQRELTSAATATDAVKVKNDAPTVTALPPTGLFSESTPQGKLIILLFVATGLLVVIVLLFAYRVYRKEG